VGAWLFLGSFLYVYVHDKRLNREGKIMKILWIATLFAFLMATGLMFASPKHMTVHILGGGWDENGIPRSRTLIYIAE